MMRFWGSGRWVFRKQGSRGAGGGEDVGRFFAPKGVRVNLRKGFRI